MKVQDQGVHGLHILKIFVKFNVKQKLNLSINKMETYRKVFIKTVMDLPKEKGFYFVCNKLAFHGDVYGRIQFDSKSTAIYNKWLNAIDWYLQPQEQETRMIMGKESSVIWQEKPSEQSVEDKNLKSILIDLESGAIDKYAAYDLINTLYASQKHLPTDEDVKAKIVELSIKAQQGQSTMWLLKEFWQWLRDNIK